MLSKLFKRRKKCIHMWELYDYETGIDVYDSKYENFKLTCVNCNKTRTTNPYEYRRLKDIGLVVDKNNK